MFIVIEGLDRSGKSTQLNLLFDALGGEEKVVKMKFPDTSTEIGKRIERVLKREEKSLPPKKMHRLFRDNRVEAQEIIKGHLNRGMNVLCDRYIHSGIAYSMAKGVPYPWCENEERGLIRPDIVIFMDIAPLVAAERAGYGNELYEKLEFQENVWDMYYYIIDQEEKDLDNAKIETQWILVDASGSVHEIHSRILGDVREAMIKEAIVY